MAVNLTTSRLMVTIGLPRSGKSTHIKQWLTETNIHYEAGYRASVVVGDDIRKAISGERYNSHCEESVRNTKHLMVKTLMYSNEIVIVDDTHTRLESLWPLFQLDPFLQIVKIGPWPSDKTYSSHLELCLERAELTGQSDLKPIIQRLSGNLVQLEYEFTKKTERLRLESLAESHIIRK